MALNYSEVFQFMKEFEVDLLNRFDELIIDEPTNTYTWIGDCKDIDDVKTRVVFSMCRPIGKGLPNKHADRLLRKIKSYFKVDLSKEDMLLMYTELCYLSKLEEFKGFIREGFPIDKLKNNEEMV